MYIDFVLRWFDLPRRHLLNLRFVRNPAPQQHIHFLIHRLSKTIHFHCLDELGKKGKNTFDIIGCF